MATQTTSIWASLGQIAIAAAASYGMTKLANNDTGWVPYRNQMMQNMAATAMTAAMAQFTTTMQQAAATSSDTQATAQ